MELWGFKVDGVWLSPNFQRPLAGKLCVRPPKVLEVQPCKNELEVLYHHAKFCGARISPAAGAPKNVEFFSLSVCLFVTLLNVRDCTPDFTMKTLEYRNDFDADE